jgi:CubicO group peptidase (beta-lactamase class C family)
MKLLSFLLVIFSLNSCQAQTKEANKQFAKEVVQLKDYYHIPGMALLIKKGNQVMYEQYLGYSDLEAKTPVDSSTLFPVASLTKPFASVLLLQLAEEKKLSLDEPVSHYLKDNSLPPAVQVKHILSHTSQGEAGKHFYYSSSRFAMLTRVIEKASGQSFAQLLKHRILDPLQLNHIFLLDDKASGRPYGKRLVKGYEFDGKTKEGYYDYGYSASAGMVSNLHDLAAFSMALDKNVLMDEKSKQLLFSPFTASSPYGLGIFTQQFLSKNIIWGYGQYDSFSSLLLKVPEDDLTLIVFANNNLMSDAPRLIYGDITYSLFALSFLKNYVFDAAQLSLLEKEQEVVAIESSTINNLPADYKILFRQKLLAQALSASFMGQTNEKELEISWKLLQKTFSLFPEVQIYGNLSLMHNLFMLKTAGDVHIFDKEFMAIGEKLLGQHKENPYANYYMGNYYNLINQQDKAIFHFNAILNAPNFKENWYTSEAAAYLKKVQLKR